MTSHLDERAGRRRGGEAGDEPEPERAGRRRDRGAGEGADHVERAVREIDQPHDAEDQRQPGRHQEQHDAELQAVQQLLDDEGGLQSESIVIRMPRSGSPVVPVCRMGRRGRQDPRRTAPRTARDPE